MDTKETLRQLHRGVRYLFENSVRSVLSWDRMKERVDDRGNSVAWLMWHMARSEDVVVASLIQQVPQLLLTDDWGPKIGLDAEHIGTGHGDDEVADFTTHMDVEAVDAYWQAVAKSSFAWLKSTTEQDLDVVPDLNERLNAIPPIIAGGGNDMAASFWSGISVGQLFSRVVVSHGYVHVGQMQEIAGRLGVKGWF